MAEGTALRVNIGSSEFRYFARTADKKQVLYVPVVQNTRRYDEAAGAWVDGEPIWYNDAMFEGADADLIRDHYQKGDSLIVFGKVEKHTNTKDGQTFHSNRLYVKMFGPDPKRMDLNIDRSRRQSHQHDTTSPAVAQSHDAAPAEASPDQGDATLGAEEPSPGQPLLEEVSRWRDSIRERLGGFAVRAQREAEAAAGHAPDSNEWANAKLRVEQIAAESDEYAHRFGFQNAEALADYLGKLDGSDTAARWAQTLPQTERELRDRLNHLVESRYIDTPTGREVLAAWNAHQDDPAAMLRDIDAVLTARGVAPAAALYVASPIRSSAYGDTLLGWNETARQATTAAEAETTATAAATPLSNNAAWEEVAKIRQELRGTTPAMSPQR